MKITAAPARSAPQTREISAFLPEEFPDFPDGGLERDVSDQDLGSLLLLDGLFLSGRFHSGSTKSTERAGKDPRAAKCPPRSGSFKIRDTKKLPS